MMLLLPYFLSLVAEKSLAQFTPIESCDGLSQTSSQNTSDCGVRAWVRAPDLLPGQIIQGDVKIKVDGLCDDILSYSVGLRFSERSVVKTRRADVLFPEPPKHDLTHFRSIQDDIFGSRRDPRAFRLGPNVTAWDVYANSVRNESLWIVKEEERIAFEVRSPLGVFVDGLSLERNIEETFALLVPNTNYPPATLLNGYSFGGQLEDTARAEHIYQYFAEVTFSNGTTREVSAGHTAYLPSFSAITDHLPETINITLDIGNKDDLDKAGGPDNFVLEVTFPTGQKFYQGSQNNLTIVAYQVNSRMSGRLDIYWPDVRLENDLHWASSFVADNNTKKQICRSADWHGLQQRSGSKSLDDNREIYRQSDRDAVWLFEDDETRGSESGLSTLPAVRPFFVSETAFPHFAMHFSTYQPVLRFQATFHPTLNTETNDKEEYDWVPWEQKDDWKSAVRFQANLPIEVIPTQKSELVAPGSDVPVHYLSPGARAPIFVDPRDVPRLRSMSVQKRDTLAPVAEPRVREVSRDQIKLVRYAQGAGPYVGETWQKKVLGKQSGKATVDVPREHVKPLLVQRT